MRRLIEYDFQELISERKDGESVLLAVELAEETVETLRNQDRELDRLYTRLKSRQDKVLALQAQVKALREELAKVAPEKLASGNPLVGQKGDSLL